MLMKAPMTTYWLFRHQYTKVYKYNCTFKILKEYLNIGVQNLIVCFVALDTKIFSSMKVDSLKMQQHL